MKSSDLLVEADVLVSYVQRVAYRVELDDLVSRDGVREPEEPSCHVILERSHVEVDERRIGLARTCALCRWRCSLSL